MWARLFEVPEVAVAIAFVIAILAVGRRASDAVTKLLDARTARIKEQLDQAQSLCDEATRALAEIQLKQRDALKEADAIISHAKEEAERIGERAKRDLEASIERRKKLAVDNIAMAERKAVAEVRAAAVDVAIGAARLVISENLKAERGEALVDQAIADLPRRLN